MSHQLYQPTHLGKLALDQYKIRKRTNYVSNNQINIFNHFTVVYVLLQNPFIYKTKTGFEFAWNPMITILLLQWYSGSILNLPVPKTLTASS